MKKSWIGLSLSLAAVVLAAQPRLLRGAPPPSCGTSGSVRERIADCATRRSSRGPYASFDWSLVTHMPEGSEVWRDESTGLVWSDAVRDYVTLDQAESACQGSLPNHEDGYITRDEIRWRLPSHDDYATAEEHGIRDALPNMLGYGFWTPTRVTRGYDSVWVFDGTDGGFEMISPFGDTRRAIYRCVGAGV